MEWIWDAANSLGVVALAVWAWFGFSYLGEENDQRKANIRKAQAMANEASATSLEAQRDARYARKAVNELSAEKQVVVGNGLPDTPHNKSLVEKLRGAAHRAELKRAEELARSKAAHPAGLRRSAVTNRYATSNPVQTTQSGIDYIPVAAAIALTMDTNSSYSDSSSSSASSYDSGSSSSSSDSGSFGGGDSGSF